MPDSCPPDNPQTLGPFEVKTGKPQNERLFSGLLPESGPLIVRASPHLQTSGPGGAGYNSLMRATVLPDVASYSYAGAGYASPDAVCRPIPTPFL
jgi:hypothetical protein